MLENLTKYDLYIGLILNGIFTGIGTTIGNYFAQKKLIKRLEKKVRA